MMLSEALRVCSTQFEKQGRTDWNQLKTPTPHSLHTHYSPAKTVLKPQLYVP